MTPHVEQHSDLLREINEVLAELGCTAEHEAQLLNILHKGWLRGPRTKAFNRNYRSLQLRRCHLDLCLIYQYVERRRRAQKAAALAPKALHTVRKLIEALPPSDAERLRATEETLRDLLDEQSALARKQPPRKRGGQADSSRIPDLALVLLIDHYIRATGALPTKYQDGAFVEFAAAILEIPAPTVLRHLKPWIAANP